MALSVSIPCISVALYQLKLCFHILYPIHSHINSETHYYRYDILFANGQLRHKVIRPRSHDQETPELGCAHRASLCPVPLPLPCMAQQLWNQLSVLIIAMILLIITPRFWSIDRQKNQLCSPPPLNFSSTFDRNMDSDSIQPVLLFVRLNTKKAGRRPRGKDLR